MPIDVSVWRIDEGLNPVPLKGMDYESDLQEIIATDLSIIDPGLMVIGREVATAFGQRVDILAIDSDGNLVVLELKRETTPREVVSQLLDYGHWVRGIKADEGQVPGRGVRVRHPDCTAQAAVDCVSGASCSASCFVVTPGVR